MIGLDNAPAAFSEYALLDRADISIFLTILLMAEDTVASMVSTGVAPEVFAMPNFVK